MDAIVPHLPASAAIYEAALEGLARVDAEIYRRIPSLPSIYEPSARVRYEREPREAWRHVGDVIGEAHGDCEDLAAARVGELRTRHGEMGARVLVKRVSPRICHAIVRRASGALEDPSRRLGMGRTEEVMHDGDMIGADPTPGIAELSWTIERVAPGSWRGTVRIPIAGARALMVREMGKTREAAGKSALSRASRVLDSPAARALIPPQARMALSLVRRPEVLSAAKKLGSLFGL